MTIIAATQEGTPLYRSGTKIRRLTIFSRQDGTGGPPRWDSDRESAAGEGRPVECAQERTGGQGHYIPQFVMQDDRLHQKLSRHMRGLSRPAAGQRARVLRGR